MIFLNRTIEFLNRLNTYKRIKNRSNDFKNRTNNLKNGSNDLKYRLNDLKNRSNDFLNRTNDFLNRTNDFKNGSNDLKIILVNFFCQFEMALIRHGKVGKIISLEVWILNMQRRTENFIIVSGTEKSERKLIQKIFLKQICYKSVASDEIFA